MKLLYKFASRSRPRKFFEVLDNIHSLARHDDFIILCSFDNDDICYNNKDFKLKLQDYPKVVYNFSDNKTKIQAINADVNEIVDFDILINVSDDQKFIMEGFDLEIIKSFEKYFPNLDGALHYPEKYSRCDTIVLSIMGRKLYEYFGYIYNPIYLSMYCDDEFTRIVRMLNKYWFRPVNIFIHEHPAFIHSLPKDELYFRNMNLNWQATDNQLYIQRRDQNFGLY